MCLLSLKKSPTIANTDIRCYKVVDSNFNSPMIGFHYEVGKTYSEDFETEPFRGPRHIHYRINKGLHTFTSFRFACAACGPWNMSKIKESNWKGSGIGVIILKCIIPKGSEYYVNSTETELVSNKLIVKSIHYNYEKSTML